MTASIQDAIDPPFEILAPSEVSAPFVFNSPHSGRVYPKSFLDQAKLDFATLRRSEDSFVDELFADVVKAGVPLMRATFPRAFLDLNREPYELDPRMFDGRLPPFANTRSLRVSGGLGTIARVVGESQEIYRRRLTVMEALERIETLYKPYHQTLRRLIARTQRDFGRCILVDCHSMPSSPLRDDAVRADIVLGDRYGTSCAAIITDALEQELKARGYSVMRNKPYAGGYNTEHYGNPSVGLHAVQIEINRGLYMDEAHYEKSAGFAAVKADLSEVSMRLFELSDLDFGGARAAAE